MKTSSTFPGRRLVGVLALAASATLAGCFRMDYSITLEEDLSGEAELAVRIELDRAAYVLATFQRQFSGEEGPPTDDEIEAARAEMLAQMDDGGLEEENLRAQIEPDLPPGVRLLDAAQSRDGLDTHVVLRLAFDHLSALNDVGPDSGPGAGAEPFGGMKIVDEGDTFVLRNDPMNPLEEARREGPTFDGLETMMEAMFGGLRIGFSIEAPFEIVEHNATTREGNRLSWVYDYEALQAGIRNGVFVRYRK